MIFHGHMRGDLGEKHEERVGLGVEGPRHCGVSQQLGVFTEVCPTPVGDWGPLLTLLNPHFLMPLPKAVLRMQGDNVCRNSQRRSEYISFRELYKDGLCLINHVLPKLTQCFALCSLNESFSKPDGDWPRGHCCQF